jgi:hypothetical protein
MTAAGRSATFRQWPVDVPLPETRRKNKRTGPLTADAQSCARQISLSIGRVAAFKAARDLIFQIM